MVYNKRRAFIEQNIADAYNLKDKKKTKKKKLYAGGHLYSKNTRRCVGGRRSLLLVTRHTSSTRGRR